MNATSHSPAVAWRVWKWALIDELTMKYLVQPRMISVRM